MKDSFSGYRLIWTHHGDTIQDSLEERRAFSVRLPKRHAATLLPAYLDHLSATANHLERTSRSRRLHTNSTAPRGSAAWTSIPFCHPATFDTLALNPELKSSLLADLSSFSAGKEFYRGIGRPWKRGYLLHGQPGSGKSSLVAAMANYLHYDVYDLELTQVTTNAELRTLLLQTTNRSVIVIEDIDCSLHLTGDRLHRNDATSCKRRRLDSSIYDEDSDDDNTNNTDQQKVTLSGLLNFTDGLWSCCGEERIIIFTTNYVSKIDPALLRAGRMDVHVCLGSCGVSAMRELVQRYINVPEHELLDEAESFIKAGVEITPAEVGEMLLRNRDNKEKALRELVLELKTRSRSGRVSMLDEGWLESVSESHEGSLEKKTKEDRVSFLGRLRSLTKSESGRRGI